MCDGVTPSECRGYRLTGFMHVPAPWIRREGGRAMRCEGLINKVLTCSKNLAKRSVCSCTSCQAAEHRGAADAHQNGCHSKGAQ